MKTKIIECLLCLALLGSLLMGCGQQEAVVTEVEPEEQEAVQESGSTSSSAAGNQVLGGSIGISFPSEEEESQKAQAEEMESQLSQLGYGVTVAYAGGDAEKQAKQIKSMIKDKVSCLIILPIDSSRLTNALEKASKQGISVFSYDKLIMGSDKVSYYVGFDDRSIGKAIGEYLIKEKKLDTAKKEKKTYSVEYFMGELNDGNSQLMYLGLTKALKSYIKDGVVESRSLRTAYADVSVAKASVEIAQQSCDNIMKANYMDAPVDIVCVGSDQLAGGIIKALQAQSSFEKEFPVVVGCDGDTEAFARIEEGTQAFTVYKYQSQLPGLCVDLVNKEIQGEVPKELASCDNGETKIPSVFGEIKSVDQSNYQQVMKEEGISLE